MCLRIALVTCAGLEEPRSVILSSSEVIITWFEPTTPNGMITQYRLYNRLSSQGAEAGESSEDWLIIYSGDSTELSYQHTGLNPGTTQQYRVEVSTAYTVFF